VLQFTSPVVLPLRKLLPPAGRFDVASLAALLLVQLAKTGALRLVAGFAWHLGPLLVAAPARPSRARCCSSISSRCWRTCC